MEIDFSKFSDKPSLSKGLGSYARARGFAFGIMAGWLEPQVIDQMISLGMTEDGTEVYQVACLACDNAMRRPFTRRELESAKFAVIEFERICHDGFNSEAPCAHFDQFLQFMETLAVNSDYAKELDDQIRTYARLVETSSSYPPTIDPLDPFNDKRIYD